MLKQVRLTHIADGEDAEAWVRAIESWDGDGAVKRDRKRSVYRTKILGSVVAVKLQHFEGLWRSLRFRTGVGPFDADRELACGQLLRVARIVVAPMLVCARARLADGGGLVSVAISEWLEGPTLLEQMGSEHDAEVRREIAMGAGRVVGKLLEAGLVNTDHKPSNQICVTPEVRPSRIGMIDVGGVKPSPAVLKNAARMLSAMVLEPTGCGCTPSARDAAWCLRGVTEALGPRREGARVFRKELVRRVGGLVEAHGDPTPKVNPLHR